MRTSAGIAAVMSVSMKPGATAVVLIPSRATSGDTLKFAAYLHKTAYTFSVPTTYGRADSPWIS